MLLAVASFGPSIQVGSCRVPLQTPPWRHGPVTWPAQLACARVRVRQGQAHLEHRRDEAAVRHGDGEGNVDMLIVGDALGIRCTHCRRGEFRCETSTDGSKNDSYRDSTTSLQGLGVRLDCLCMTKTSRAAATAARQGPAYGLAARTLQALTEGGTSQECSHSRADSWGREAAVAPGQPFHSDVLHLHKAMRTGTALRQPHLRTAGGASPAPRQLPWPAGQSW